MIMKRFIISEQEKEDILGQHKDMIPKPKFPEDRRTLDTNLKSFDFTRLKSQGLTPYYVETKTGNKVEMVELPKPLKQGYHNRPKEVYLLTPDEYEKIKKLTDNINEMIELKLKQIELYKQYIPAVAAEIIKKK
jgi:hypothetical protein